jgi:integrase
MRAKITKSAINRLQPGQTLADTSLVGFTARRLPSGSVAYYFRYRDPKTGEEHAPSLGHNQAPEQARKKAHKAAARIGDGDRPESAAVEAAKRRQTFGYTVNQLLDDFVKRYVRGSTDERPEGLRSADEIERCFDVYVRRRLGKKFVNDLRRSDIVKLLDEIEDSGAPVMADRVLAHLRKALRWYATRDDTFVVPIVPGMARTRPKERERKRILDDQEIRDLWQALDSTNGTVPACFARFVRTLLLSGQRRAMVSNARWDEIDGRDWLIAAARNKGKVDHLVPLTDAMVVLLGPRGKGFVFTSDGGKTAFSGFSKAKAALDAKLAEIRKAAGRPAMKHWTFHDLRRSCRSLLSRAGVSPDHAERILGHAIPGVRGTYDRHEYADEKRDALEKLSALAERILHPDESIIRFPKGRKKR